MKLAALAVGLLALATLVWFAATRGERDAVAPPQFDPSAVAAHDDAALLRVEPAEGARAEASTPSSIDSADADGFHARIVDAVTRAAIAGARVHAEIDGVELARALADAAGRVALVLPSDERALVAVEADGYSFHWVHDLAGHRSRESELVVEMARPSRLRAHVLSTSGTPAHGLLLAESRTLARWRGLPNGVAYPRQTWNARIGFDGVAELECLPSGVELGLVVVDDASMASTEPGSITLDAASTRDATFRVVLGGRIVGTVRDEDGRPLAGVEVGVVRAGLDDAGRVLGHTDDARHVVECDAHGEFAIEDVPFGAWTVELRTLQRIANDERRASGTSAAADFYAAIGERAVLDPERREARVALVAERALSISGRVLDENGAPARRVRVEATRDGAGGHMACRTRDDGRFTLGLLGRGGHQLVAIGRSGSAPSEIVIAEAGATDVEIRLRPGASLGGDVIDAASRTRTPADVRALPEPHAAPISMQDDDETAAHDEGFECRGLAPGTYTLVATTSDGRAGTLHDVDLAVGQRRVGLVIEARPAAHVEVANSSGASALVETWIAGQRFEARTLRPAEIAKLALPAERVTLRVLRAGREPLVRELDLAPAGRVQLEFTDEWK